MISPIQCDEIVMGNNENRDGNQNVEHKNDDQIPRTFYPEFFFQLLISEISYFDHIANGKS